MYFPINTLWEIKMRYKGSKMKLRTLHRHLATFEVACFLDFARDAVVGLPVDGVDR